MLLVSIVEALQNIILEASDKLIIGNILGSDAVAGIMLIEPIISFGMIFEILVGSGASVMYARAIGDYDDEKKRRVLGVSTVISLAFGLFMCIISIAGEDMILDVLGAEGIVRTYGEQYLYFYRFVFLITPLFAFLSELVYIDGDEIRSILAGLVLILGNAVISFFLTKLIGMKGASLGSAIGTVLALIIVLSHFMVKKYRIKPEFVFRPDDLHEMLVIGGTDAIGSFFECVYIFLLNLFVVRMFGEEYLAVLAVTNIIYELMAIGSGVNDAMKTMLLSYRSDNNPESMRELLKYGLRIMIIMGIIFIAVVWVAAPVLPKAYGIDTGSLPEFTAWACRLTALSSIACVFNGLFLEYYLDIGRYKLQILGNLLDTLVIRLICNVLGALSFGAIGIWIGESICTYISVALFLMFVYFRYGRENFPFLIKEKVKKSLNLSFNTTSEEIVKARDRLEEFLTGVKIVKRARYVAMLFLEEMSELIREVNPPDRIVNIDAYYICGRDFMNVVIWSDGEMIDLSEDDRIPQGLASYLIVSIISGCDESKYQKTAGYNRASFVIPYKIFLWEDLKEKRNNKRKEHL